MDNQFTKKQVTPDKMMFAVQIFRKCKFDNQMKESIHEIKKRERSEKVKNIKF
mgnify:CR=1 FL=1